MEVHGGIARIVRWWPVLGLVLAAKALERSPRLNKCPGDGEMVIAEQPQLVRLQNDVEEELPRNVVPEQALTILGEGGRIEARLIEIHIEKPSEQNVVV